MTDGAANALLLESQPFVPEAIIVVASWPLASSFLKSARRAFNNSGASGMPLFGVVSDAILDFSGRLAEVGVEEEDFDANVFVTQVVSLPQ